MGCPSAMSEGKIPVYQAARRPFASGVSRPSNAAAAEGPIYGLAMIEELRRHGYKLSTGTLYPILQAMEDKGYLVSMPSERGARSVASTGRRRRGAAAKQKVQELFGEFFSEP